LPTSAGSLAWLDNERRLLFRQAAAYNRTGTYRAIEGRFMPLLQKGLRLAAGRMPKVVKPRAHAVLDYAVVGSFVLTGVLFWRRNKRASFGSLICGAAAALNVLMTDYPGGRYPYITYKSHGHADAGIAGLTAAIPRILSFEDEPEARIFAAQAVAETAIAGLTDFDYYDEDSPDEAPDGE
jgi:hypothetical protein